MFLKILKDMWICLFYYNRFLSKILTGQLLCGKTPPLGRFSLMSQALLFFSWHESQINNSAFILWLKLLNIINISLFNIIMP